MKQTKIKWATHAWNPIWGCTPESEACTFCYAKRMHERFWDTPFSDIVFHPERLGKPGRRKKPSIVFVGNMTDIFHPKVKDEWIDEIINVILSAPQHTFMILTKRAERMEEYFTQKYEELLCDGVDGGLGGKMGDWVIPNLWIGVTVENQKEGDRRVPLLLRTRAARRFVSMEPLLEEVDMSGYSAPAFSTTGMPVLLDLVIVGGESGESGVVRPMKAEWVEKIFSYCSLNDIPFYFKQWGSSRRDDDRYYPFEDVQEMPHAQKEA